MNVRCPKHDDRTPSVTIYSNGAWCHAGCGFIPLKDLGLNPDNYKEQEKYVEDIEETLSKIDQLPLKPYRGFMFPADAISSYIVWPDRSYYKQRMHEPNAKPKYRGPSGVSQPPLWVRQGTSETLLVVEGELDCLSAAAAVEEVDLISPGSSSNFNNKLLPLLKNYCNIYIIADADSAGLEAVMSLGALIHNMMPGTPFRKILKASGGQDLNDILVESGREELRAHILRLLSKEM